MRLYHATSVKNKETILKEGILRNKPQNFDGISMRGYIYFAFDAEAAISFVESSDTFEGEEIVVFSVNSEDLDLTRIAYDWNNRCEYESEIISIAYDGNIDPRCLSLLTKEEIERAVSREFSDLKHIDDSSRSIWEKVGSIFDEEVETNKENPEIE